MRGLLTPEQIEEAHRLFEDGWTFNMLGEKFGCHHVTMRRALNPEYRKCERRSIKRENAASVATKADGMARLAEIPPDSRSLTQRVFGDPLPGRSALDRKPA